MKTVMIVAGESSGEFYGSLLAASLKRIWSDLRIIGIGGERMREVGVDLLSGIAGSFGLQEVLPSLMRILDTYRRAKRAIVEFRPSVVVLIDYPEFNMRLGRFAKRYGIKVCYFVSPHVWAWRKKRVRRMKAFVERMAVILPFEEAIYRKEEIPCEFVGHPVMEEIERVYDVGDVPVPSQGAVRRSLGIIRGNPVLSLLPGSRSHELESLLPIFVEFVRAFRSEYSDARFILPLAPNIERNRFEVILGILAGEGVKVMEGEAIRALASSDAAVIASGTATLQAALLGTPMVIVYKVAPLTFFLGKMLVNVKYISLVNILAGKEVVSELIQHHACTEGIMQEMRRILHDDEYRAHMRSSLEEIRKPFVGKRASQRVAEMVGEIAEWKY